MRGHDDLREYQRWAIRQMIDNQHLGLFLDMGMGKTAISLYWIARMKDLSRVNKTLVVSIKQVINNVWQQEASEWEYTKDLTFETIHGTNKKKLLNSPADVHLINYEGMIWLAPLLKKYISKYKTSPYQAIIFDESTKIKDASTKRFKAWKTIFKFFKYRYILTATPTPNSLADIWAQWYILDQGDAFDTAFTRFRRNYFYQVSDYVWVPHPETRNRIAEKVKKKAIRLRANDYLEMPEVVHNNIPLTLPKNLMGMYKELQKEFYLELEGCEIEALNTASLSMKLRQFIQGAVYKDRDLKQYEILHSVKLDALKHIVESNIENVIVAIQFRYEVDLIRKKFNTNIPALVGGVDKSESQSIIKSWNNKQTKILIVQPASAAHGLNLQAGGHTIIWYGLTWSLEEYDQLIGRLNRQGQKNKNVFVHHLVMRGTVDEAISSALERKDKTQQSILASIKSFVAPE